MTAFPSAQRQANLNDLRKTAGLSAVKIAEIERKQELQHKEIMQVFGFLGDIETRLEAMKTLNIRAGLFTDQAYEELWDEIKGLRAKGPDEPLEAGDFISLTYKVTSAEGQELASDRNFPVRLGAGSLMFEGELLGKTRSQLQDHSFSQTYTDPYPANPELAGKTVTFQVTVAKVKSKKTGKPSE